MNIPQIFYWNYRWKKHVEEGLFFVFLHWSPLFLPFAGLQFPSNIFCFDFRRAFVFFLLFSANISMVYFLFSLSRKVFANSFAKKNFCHGVATNLPPPSTLRLTLTLRWAVEGCQNLTLYLLAQQEHSFLNICSNIIQINGYLRFFGSTCLFD